MAEVGNIADSIYLLQEPYYTTAGRPSIRNPSKFHSKGAARAAIYASSLQSFSFVPMHQFTSHDIATGTIEGGCLENSVVIASIYLDIEQPTILPQMEELVKFCQDKHMCLIMGIDSNAHSPLWGCNDCNKRGQALEEFIFENQLFVHNIGSEPTFQVPARNARSIIDITLSLNFAEDLQDWHVSETETFSDHNMICYALDSIQSPEIWSRNYSKAKWKVFSDFILSNLNEPPELWSESIAEDSLEYFYSIIEKGLDLSCPKHKIKRKDSLIWWNRDCENARNHYIAVRRKVRRKFSRNQVITADLGNEVKAAHRSLKYIIRKSKRESFRDMVREVESVSEMSRLDKIIDRKEARSLGFVMKADGTSTSSSEETLLVMLNEHFPGNESLDDLDIRSSYEGDPRPIDSLDWITVHRIQNAIAQFKPYKAAGPDGLKPVVLQHMPLVAYKYLERLYTACIEMGFTPMKWCHSLVLFMPKPGKKSYRDARSFRPLSLTSFLLKGLERLALWRVEETALKTRPLHCRQFAFRKNYSTEHALSGALNTIESALFRKQMVMTIDLDIKGAFDNITTDAIVNAMEKRKIENNIISWYSDYLHHRTCEAQLGKSIKKAKLTRGSPQGGVKSPVIGWSISYDSFLEAYDGSAVVQFGFADDGKLIIIGIDFDMMMRVAQWALHEAEHWAASVGVSFSTEKTAVMFLNKGLYTNAAVGTGKRKRPVLFQPPVGTHLKLYNSPLDWVDESKYLGVIIDRGITFRQHIEGKIAAAKRKLMMLGKVCRDTWGPKPKASKWAYTGIVRPALAYGSIIWANKAQDGKLKDKLTQLQRLAMLLIAPVRKSTPTAALEMLYDIKPLHLFLKEYALKSALRIGITNPNWTPQGNQGHQHWLMETLPAALNERIMDNRISTIVWQQNYSVKIGKGNDIPRREWACYTDGSKVGASAGSGSVILHRDKIVKHISFSVGNSEVFQAEVSAILSSVQTLIEKGVQNSEIDILVDSQAALKSLRNPVTTSDLVRKAKASLNILGTQNNLILHYIKAHQGWEYNEIADRNANNGRDLVTLPENVPSPSRCQIYSIVEDMIEQQWVESWDKGPYRQTKYFIRGPSSVRALLLLQNTRDLLGRLVRYITGHAFLRHHNAVVLHNTNQPPGDNSCRLCEDPDMAETPHHIVTECDRLCNWRASTLGAYVLDEYPNWKPCDLAKFLSRKEIILLETETDY